MSAFTLLHAVPVVLSLSDVAPLGQPQGTSVVTGNEEGVVSAGVGTEEGTQTFTIVVAPEGRG